MGIICAILLRFLGADDAAIPERTIGCACCSASGANRLAFGSGIFTITCEFGASIAIPGNFAGSIDTVLAGVESIVAVGTFDISGTVCNSAVGSTVAGIAADDIIPVGIITDDDGSNGEDAVVGTTVDSCGICIADAVFACSATWEGVGVPKFVDSKHVSDASVVADGRTTFLGVWVDAFPASCRCVEVFMTLDSDGSLLARRCTLSVLLCRICDPEASFAALDDSVKLETPESTVIRNVFVFKSFPREEQSNLDNVFPHSSQGQDSQQNGQIMFWICPPGRITNFPQQSCAQSKQK